MRRLVVFYSLTGNTKFIAGQIADVAGADLLEIAPKKDVTLNRMVKLQGLKKVLQKESPELGSFPVNPADYDLIFLGMPIWSYTYPPAIRSFLENVKLEGKKLALFCCYGGYFGKTFERIRDILADNNVIAEKAFLDPIVGNDRKAGEAREWAVSILEKAEAGC